MNTIIKLLETNTTNDNDRTMDWFPPTALGLSRLVLLIIGQLLTWLVLRQLAAAQPWATAAGLANFYLPLTADLGSFLLLAWILHHERRTISQLINYNGRLGREIALGLGLFIALTIVFQIASVVGGLIAFGPTILDPAAASNLALDFVPPPQWVLWWSVLVLPITVGVVEELVYRGYLQPRFTQLTGRPWLGNVLTSFFFGLQHIVLPWATWQVSLSRFVATFLAGLFLGWVFHRQQRLLPLIIAHWALDLVFLGVLPLMAMGVN